MRAAVILLSAVICAAAEDDGARKFDVSALEQKIHARVNEARRKENAAVLAWDDCLAKIARAHSQDMGARDYLGHDNPEGEEPMDRVKKNGLVEIRDFTAVAENIFRIDTVREVRTYTGPSGEDREIIYNSPESIVRQCLTGWLKSPGHRKNLLNPLLEKQGIGVAISDKGEVLITQLLIK